MFKLLAPKNTAAARTCQTRLEGFPKFWEIAGPMTEKWGTGANVFHLLMPAPPSPLWWWVRYASLLWTGPERLPGQLSLRQGWIFLHGRIQRFAPPLRVPGF